MVPPKKAPKISNQTEKRILSGEVVSDKKKQVTASETKNEIDIRQVVATEKTGFWTMILAVFTILLAIVGGFTVKVLWCQFLEMQTDARIDQRAWMGVSKINPVVDNAKKTVTFEISCKNTGKTVALNVVGFAMGTEDIKKVPYCDKEPTSSVGPLVNPGSDYQFGVIAEKDSFRDITAGKTNYVYGTVWYTDIFKKRHWTQFCIVPAPNPAWIRECPEANHCRIDDY